MYNLFRSRSWRSCSDLVSRFSPFSNVIVSNLLFDLLSRTQNATLRHHKHYHPSHQLWGGNWKPGKACFDFPFVYAAWNVLFAISSRNTRVKSLVAPLKVPQTRKHTAARGGKWCEKFKNPSLGKSCVHGPRIYLGLRRTDTDKSPRPSHVSQPCGYLFFAVPFSSAQKPTASKCDIWRD